MRRGWSITTLNSVAEVAAGQAAPQGSELFGVEGHPFVRAGSLEFLVNGGSEMDLEHINSSLADAHKLRLFPADTVVFAKSGMSATKGLIYRLKQPCYVVSHLAALIPSESLVPEYLTRWLEVHPPTALISNSAYPSIRLSHVTRVSMNLPDDVEEQRRIAGILDKADGVRRKRREALAQLDTLLQSTFLDMFGDPITNPMGWQLSPLQKVAELENGDRSSNYPSGPDVVEKGVLFLSTKNIANFQLLLNECQFITHEKFRSLSRGKLRRYDIVMTLRGTLGSCAVFDCQFNSGFINAQLLIIRTTQIEPLYLHGLLSSRPMGEYLARSATGVAVKQLTSKQIGALSVPLPPIPLQRRFAAIVGSIERQKAAMRAHLAELDTLFASLQSRAFNGEL